MFPKICLSNWINQNTVIDIREEDSDFYDMLWPASTLVEVSALVTPQLKVEIEAEAVVG
jgi:enamine deaminase RidA (YjgF/YER057c/UK114 family)